MNIEDASLLQLHLYQMTWDLNSILSLKPMFYLSVEKEISL